jgi:hypothetical protein
MWDEIMVATSAGKWDYRKVQSLVVDLVDL